MVKAPNKVQAIEYLDEVGNAEDCPVTVLRNFMAHFELNDEGEFELERLGEEAEGEIMRRGYPILSEAYPDGKEAVAKERDRLWPKEETRQKKGKTEPETLAGRDIKAKSDMPTSLVNRIVKDTSKEALKEFRGKSKPS